MFKQYVDILASSFKESFESMTDAQVRSVSSIQDNRELKLFSVASSISYKDLDENISGEFNFGLPDETTALMIASEVARKMGLGELTQFDNTASEVLNEFLNILIGRAISRWDREGWSVRFSPPKLVRNKNVDLRNTLNCKAYELQMEIHSPALKLPKDISLGVTFTRKEFDQLKGKKILVVDDSGMMRGLVMKTLQQSGFHVEASKDGVEAIEKHKMFMPDLTIMDLNMPNMGGLEAISKIRESSPESNFIILTSSSRKDEVLTARELRVKNYIIKPFKADELVGKVSRAFL